MWSHAGHLVLNAVFRHAGRHELFYYVLRFILVVFLMVCICVCVCVCAYVRVCVCICRNAVIFDEQIIDLTSVITKLFVTGITV